MDTQTQDVFNAFVHLTDDAGLHHAFGPGDPVPGWTRPLIGEHVIHTGDGELLAAPVEDVVAQAPGYTEVEYDAEVPMAPPTSGPGSNRPAWVQYAQAVGQPVSDRWSRQDIIDALIRNGHIRE